MIKISLPFPPSTNTYWRHVSMGKRGTRVLISKKGRQYRSDVISECCAAQLTGLRLGGRLRVLVRLFVPDRRKRDMDNFNKALLDALSQAQVWGDDSQIDDLRVVRGHVVKGGRAVVEIEELDALRCQEAA